MIFESTAATLSTILGGGGLISEGLALVTCRALTFLTVGQAGLPNAALAGYRYRVIGANSAAARCSHLRPREHNWGQVLPYGIASLQRPCYRGTKR